MVTKMLNISLYFKIPIVFFVLLAKGETIQFFFSICVAEVNNVINE